MEPFLEVLFGRRPAGSWPVVLEHEKNKMKLRKRKRDERASLDVNSDDLNVLRSRAKLPKMKGVATMLCHFKHFLLKHIDSAHPEIETVADIPKTSWTDAIKAQFLETIWLAYKSPSQVFLFEFVRVCSNLFEFFSLFSSFLTRSAQTGTLNHLIKTAGGISNYLLVSAFS
jgi:hypothetical protein